MPTISINQCTFWKKIAGKIKLACFVLSFHLNINFQAFFSLFYFPMIHNHQTAPTKVNFNQYKSLSFFLNCKLFAFLSCHHSIGSWFSSRLTDLRSRLEFWVNNTDRQNLSLHCTVVLYKCNALYTITSTKVQNLFTAVISCCAANTWNANFVKDFSGKLDCDPSFCVNTFKVFEKPKLEKRKDNKFNL